MMDDEQEGSDTPVLHVDYFGTQHNPTHPDVKVWQGQMAWRGWVITLDGAFGPQSHGVARDFQQVQALTVDGLVGPETWASTWEPGVSETEIDAQHANSEQQGQGELDKPPAKPLTPREVADGIAACIRLWASSANIELSALNNAVGLDEDSSTVLLRLPSGQTFQVTVAEGDP